MGESIGYPFAGWFAINETETQTVRHVRSERDVAFGSRLCEIYF